MSKKSFAIHIPLGLFASIGIMVYLIENGFWYGLSETLKFLLIITLILLSIFCQVSYEYERKELKCQ